MNKHRAVIAGSAALILGFAAGAVGQEHGDPLDGTQWDLFAYRKTRPIQGTHLTARFEDGRVRGEAGCNRYSGSYTLRGDSIAVTDLSVGGATCKEPDGVMEQEEYYLRFLSEVRWVLFSGDRLRLRSPDGEELTYDPLTSKSRG